MSNERPTRRARLNLILMAAVAAAPAVGAYALYTFWRPDSFTNYGQLLPPAPISDSAGRNIDGSPFTFGSFRGKWVLLMVDSGACDDFCREKLYKMRQVRLTQGQEMERIERAWLVDDDTPPAAGVTTEFDGTRVVLGRGSTLLSRLPAERSPRDHIYLVDPIGNVMMRYPRAADPSGMKKDVSRLLKVSRIG
jgi:hypothetical protein